MAVAPLDGVLVVVIVGLGDTGAGATGNLFFCPLCGLSVLLWTTCGRAFLGGFKMNEEVKENGFRSGFAALVRRGLFGDIGRILSHLGDIVGIINHYCTSKDNCLDDSDKMEADK